MYRNLSLFLSLSIFVKRSECPIKKITHKEALYSRNSLAMTRRILCLDISLHERIFKFFSCRFIFLEIVLNALFLTQFHLIFSSSRSTYFFFFFWPCIILPTGSKQYARYRSSGARNTDNRYVCTQARSG